MVQNLHINKDEFTEEVVNQLIQDNNITIKLTTKRKRLLAVLLYLNGLDDKDEQGRFFIDNIWLSNFIGMTETNLLVALRYFISNGIIERESGSNHNCSRYKIINEENNSIRQKTVVQNSSINEENNSIRQKTVVQNSSINEENNSRDIDIELDIEKEKDIYNIIINKINNIIKENNNNLINIIEEKENNIINNIIKEKEKSSSIEINNKENKTNTKMEKELQQQINELKEQNEILTSRLNNCGRQFKAMMNTIAKLQQEINELKKENETSSELNKVNKEETPTINVIVEPTTASIEQDDTVSHPIENKALEAKKEVFQSPIEELNETFDVEAIVEEFKEAFTDVKEAQAKQIELINTFKKAGLDYYNRCELEHRISKYIKSLELINSTEKEESTQEVPTVAMEVKPIEEVKEDKKEETIPTVEVEVPTVAMEVKPIQEVKEDKKEANEVITSKKENKATEGKENTFVDSFQTNDSNSSIGEERLRYQDLKTKLYYSSLKEAQAAEVNPIYLYDYEVSRCVSSY